MSGVKWLVLVLFMVAQGCFADDTSKVHGVWKLVSYVVEVQATGEKFPPMGEHPAGYVIFTPESRVFFVLSGEGRKPGKTAEEKAELLGSLVAYTGTYRVEGDQWITSVQVAWNPEWVGTEQRRYFKVEADKLQVLTPWRKMPNWADKGMTRSIINFERST